MQKKLLNEKVRARLNFKKNFNIGINKFHCATRHLERGSLTDYLSLHNIVKEFGRYNQVFVLTEIIVSGIQW